MLKNNNTIRVAESKSHCCNHILNCCNRSLKDGRYLWRHNNVLRHIKKCIDNKKYQVSFDLDKEKSSTIPPNILVTNLIPDLVIVDKERKELTVWELTCPSEPRIDAAHVLKTEKYGHFTNDIVDYKTEVIAFEVGSHTGLITKENKGRLSNLHRYCQKGLKKSTFLKNISAIVLLSSYYLFNNRNMSDWSESTPVLGPFKYFK